MREELARSIRRAHRLCGAVILQAMAETDTSFAQIAERLEVSEGHVREWLMQYADCSIEEEAGLRIVSFVLTAMDCRLDIRFEKIPKEVDVPEERRQVVV